MRAISLIILLLAALSARPSVPPMPTDLTGVGDVAEARLHWRLRPRGTGEARWGMVWNMRDSLNYHYAELLLADRRYGDDMGRIGAKLTVARVDSGRDSLLCRSDFVAYESELATGLSLVLRCDDGAHAVLEAGCRLPAVTVPVELWPHTRAGFYAASPADTLRCELRLRCRRALGRVPFAAVAELRRRLAASADIAEGEWTYYDRNTDPLRVSLGGQYRLATLSDGRGGYTIVYLDGAPAGSRWHPLDIRGCLTPTGFVGQYDLLWLDDDGEPMGPDCSAMLSDGMLLDLRFPLYGSNVRFRRVRPDE